MHWKHFFKKDKLSLGRRIPLNNILKVDLKSDLISATIQGTEKYNLLLKSDLSMIGCSCPHASSMCYCKHMASLLFYLESNNMFSIDFTNQSNFLNLINMPMYKKNKTITIYSFRAIPSFDFLAYYFDASFDEVSIYLNYEKQYCTMLSGNLNSIESFANYLNESTNLNLNTINRLIFGRIVYLVNTKQITDIYKNYEDFVFNFNDSDKLKSDVNKILFELKQHGLSKLETVDSSLKDNFAFIQSIVDEFGIKVLSYVKKDFDKSKISTKKFYINQLEKSIIEPNIKNIPEKYKKDRDILLKLVELDAYNLKLIDPNIENYKEFIKLSIEKNPMSIKYASDEIKSDEFFVRTAINKNVLSFRHVADKFRLDKQFIYENIHNYNLLLECLDYANNSNKQIEYTANQENIILDIVKQHSEFIKYTENKYKSNYNIALEAVKQNGLLLEYIDEDLKYNLSIIKESIINNIKAYQFIPNKLKYEKQLIEILLRSDFYNNTIMDLLYSAPAYIKQNKEYVKKIVEREGIYLQCVSKELQNDKETALIALKNDELAINYIGESLKHDEDIQNTLKNYEQDKDSFLNDNEKEYKVKY